MGDAGRKAIVSASARSAFWKASTGGCVMPAPIMPMPGSLCAMAVLMIGRMPVSMTLRTSMPVGTPMKSSAGMVTLGLLPVVMVFMVRE